MTTWFSLIASAADSCLKPWIHAVVLVDDLKVAEINELYIDELINKESVDVVLRIECRDVDGGRHPQNDIELEVFRSGTDLNLILSCINHLESPLLWQGRHSVWMDSNTGKRCLAPESGLKLESLARKLRALLVTPRSTSGYG